MFLLTSLVDFCDILSSICILVVFPWVFAFLCSFEYLNFYGLSFRFFTSNLHSDLKFHTLFDRHLTEI